MDTNTFRKRIHDPNGYLDEQLQEAYAASEPGDYQLPSLTQSKPDDLVQLVPAPQIDVGMGAPTPMPFQREAIPFPTEQAVAQKDLVQQQDNPFSDERRNQMVDEANSGRVLSGIGQALSGFLAPVTGRSQDSVTNQFEGYRKKRAADTVGQFDAKKALYQSMQAKLAEKTEETRRWEAERAFDRQKLDVEMRFKAGQLGLDEAKQKLAEIEAERRASLDVDKLSLDKQKLAETIRNNKASESLTGQRIAAGADNAVNDRDVQRLSKDIQGAQQAMDKISNVENELGFALDDADVSGSELTVKGRGKVDLPGVSMWPFGRITAYDDKAKSLEQNASAIFNTVLKDRSGAAISNSELERLRTEFGQGKFGTEKLLIKALKEYKLALMKELRNREAAYSKEVRAKYEEQGGSLSTTFAQPQSGMVTITKDGQTKQATPTQADVLKKHGWVQK